MAELLPCPFCGGHFVVERRKSASWGPETYIYWLLHPSGCGRFLALNFPTEEKAVELCNTRATPPPSKGDEVREAVEAELGRALSKFPNWPTDPLHAVAVLGEEFGELTQAVLQSVYEPEKSSPEEVRKEATQVAAMALRFLSSLGQYNYQRGDQHPQALAALSTTDQRDRDARTQELETALRKIRGMSFKNRSLKACFRDSVQMASDALGVGNPLPKDGEGV